MMWVTLLQKSDTDIDINIYAPDELELEIDSGGVSSSIGLTLDDLETIGENILKFIATRKQ